ncbi:hypothetical [Yersinia pestis KIM10+]|uniref:Uncharacterized protein n=1 Tax=Yersinia pestis TaxID=632 RepID=Q8CKE5_YERPE|nr:hypothetical [Yersinia pestis KIM10+]
MIKGGATGEVEASHFNILGVYGSDEGILYLAKMLLQLAAIINLYDEYNFFVFRIKSIQLNDNLLIIAIPSARSVIAGQPDLPRLMAKAIEEDNIAINQTGFAIFYIT